MYGKSRHAVEATDVETYYRVYLEELPRLVKETAKTEWAEQLASYPKGELTKNDADIVVSLVKSMPKITQNTFIKIISDEDFTDDYEWALYVLECLKSENKK